MDDKTKIRLQEWWLEQIKNLTQRVMNQEDKRIEKIKAKNAALLGDLSIERREDIDDLYGYGVITEKKRDKLIDLWEEMDGATNALYDAKIELLQDAYREAKEILSGLKGAAG